MAEAKKETPCSVREKEKNEENFHGYQQDHHPRGGCQARGAGAAERRPGA
jgi:hypothetical protein